MGGRVRRARRGTRGESSTATDYKARWLLI